MDLRDAHANNEFFLDYQPTFDLRDMSPTGVEALIRWRSPTRGVVQPDAFIPLLEETGLITQIGQWVLQEACKQGAQWRTAGHQIGMAVNVSGRQLDTDAFITDVQEALSSTGLEPSALTIEITETTLMRNVEDTARRLAAIKELGVRIAIDDFGTGYSSLSYLANYPINRVKIAQELMFGVDTDHRSATVVRAAIRLAHELGIEIIAEGIETEGQEKFLLSAGCERGQGFYYSKGVDAAHATELLRSGKIEPARLPLRLVQPTAA
jgi:EAL domain-containing protein (putative c-di-GMP-specific phosphodiesterase class I)